MTYSWGEIARSPRLWPLGIFGLGLWGVGIVIWLALLPFWAGLRLVEWACDR